jgi:UDP-glucose 4-epimerase
MTIRRALVTGGAGFVGSHVTEALLAAGAETAVLDNLATGHQRNVPRGVRLYRTDLRSAGEVGRALEEFRPEVVMHLGAQSSVVVSVRDPRLDVDVNVVGMVTLLQACVRHEVRKVVFASSGGTLYGEPDHLPCSEDQPIRPRSPYGASKAAGEALLQAWAATFGLSGTALRLGNVYGPRQDPNGEAGVIAIFAGRMLRREPVTIFGDGEQERDYVYATDVARMFLLAGEEEQSGVYNVGTGIGTSVNALYRALAEATEYRMPPVMAPARAGEVFKVALDPAKAMRRLGWKPHVSLDEGIRRVVEGLRAG